MHGNISIGSPSIIIAILDNGVQSNHPDLDGHLVTGYDVVDNDYTTDPYNSTFDYHGTACAGVAAAETNNGIGIAGVDITVKLCLFSLHIMICGRIMKNLQPV